MYYQASTQADPPIPSIELQPGDKTHATLHKPLLPPQQRFLLPQDSDPSPLIVAYLDCFRNG